MLQTDAIAKYCTSLEALGRSPRTINTNRERLVGLQVFLAKHGVQEIEEINPELIDLYISMSYHRGLSLFTVAGRIQVIKGFFAWSVRRNYLERSPAAHLKKPRLNYKAKNKAILQEDLETLIRFARKSQKIAIEAMLLFLADTGCRVGELCSVNVDDLDFVNNEVLVSGKTGERIIDFTSKTAAVLKSYLCVREEMALTTQALFVNKYRTRITPNQVYIRFRWLGHKAGVKRFNPQAIRHRVGQGWLDQGANLELVRQKLGHTDIQTTALFYAHQDRNRSKMATKHFCIVKDV